MLGRVLCKIGQIGDRRGPNALEGRIRGPSALLPTGEAFCSMTLNPSWQSLAICVSDRRDYYHQLAAPAERARCNRLAPVFESSLFRGEPAYEELKQRCKQSSKGREFAGDFLAEAASLPHLGRRPFPKAVQACFRSILQGDHLKVDIACSAHEGFLQAYGLLDLPHRVLGRLPLQEQTCYQGLVIDDFFCLSKISRELASSLGPETPTEACLTLKKALLAYEAHGILGAPEKDQVNLTKGAEIDSSEPTLRQGVATVSAPKQKRFALADISFEACLLPATSDALWCSLLGGWTSALTFRRQAFCCLDEAFRLAPSASLDPCSPKILKLPRVVAQEVIVTACLSPILVSDIAAPCLPRLFATDSSEANRCRLTKAWLFGKRPTARVLSAGLRNLKGQYLGQRMTFGRTPLSLSWLRLSLLAGR